MRTLELQRTLVVLVAALTVTLSPYLANAGGKPTKADVVAAKKSDGEGRRLEGRKKWREAREAYLAALDLQDQPETRIRLARVAEKLGDLLGAAEQLRKALDADKLPRAARAKATAMLERVEKRTPTIELTLPADFDGTVKLDGETLPASALASRVPVNPGRHTIRAKTSGVEPFFETVLLDEGETKVLAVKLATVERSEADEERRAPEDRPAKVRSTSGVSPWAYVGLGVGVVGVGFGTYMGLRASSTKNELASACANNTCGESQRDLYDRGRTQANLSTAGFIVGAVGLGTGTVLLLTFGGKEGKTAARVPRAAPYLGPGSAGVQGRF